MTCPTTALSALSFEKLPWPQSWPITKFIHITVPVRGAYRGSSHGCATATGLSTPKHAASRPRSTAAYFSDSRVSGWKHSLGMASRSSRSAGTGPLPPPAPASSREDTDASTRGAEIAEGRTDFRDDDDDEATATTADARSCRTATGPRARPLERAAANARGKLAVANIACALPVTF